MVLRMKGCASRHVIPVLRLLTLLGYLGILFFALAALFAYGTLEAGLLSLSGIGFVVINSRILFPWPLPASEVLKTYTLARCTLWVALLIGILGAVGVCGAYTFGEWRSAFAILGVTSALNLVILRRRQ
jgi:hypothetical protein